MGEDALYGKALSNALSFDSSESGSSKLSVKNKATVALIRCVISLWYHISRGLRRCSSMTDRAMPEPRRVGRVTDLTPTLFCMLAITNL